MDQSAVPELIEALNKAKFELLQPSQGSPKLVERDPHLRLRRTLTPSSNQKGLKKYNEAQFMIYGSSGDRINLQFSYKGDDFQMDAYVWGNTNAKHRMVGVHGISPGVSRTRWHPLGDRVKNCEDLRFVALDWHSIDRRDKPQDEFLTMLPKHIVNMPMKKEDFLEYYPEVAHEKLDKLFLEMKSCPRSIEDGGDILRAIIEQGLGWGYDNKNFILGIKSWSGGIGISLLVKAALEGGAFRKNISGVVVMHPFSFDKENAKIAIKDLPSIVCWAKDDPLVPYYISSHYTTHSKVKLITYESGGHANFDGSSNLPNFDDEILNWMKENFGIECD